MSTTELETAQQNASPAKSQTSVRKWRRPHYDVSENADAFHVKVSLPGVAKDGVDISVDGETLSIVGSQAQRLPEGWRPLRRELPEGDFRLNLRLNVLINEEKVEARVADGVLDLTLPKADEVKPRKIKIS